jgi:hypothetical protein
VDDDGERTVGDITLFLERLLNIVDCVWYHNAGTSSCPSPPPMVGKEADSDIEAGGVWFT